MAQSTKLTFPVRPKLRGNPDAARRKDRNPLRLPHSSHTLQAERDAQKIVQQGKKHVIAADWAVY
jgi:hypothetical protein